MLLPEGFVPQLVAIDLDDTLIEHDGPVAGFVADAIARVQGLGIVVVAATGRSVTTALPVARAAGMHDWAVCSNGSLLARVVPEEVVETITFDPGDLLRHIEKRVPNGSYAVECEDGTFKTNRIFKHTALTVAVREVPFDRLLDDPVIRVVVRSDEHLDEGLGFLAEELGLHSVVFGTGDIAWLDIGPQGVSKATMLARLCGRLGIDESQTMAIGDSMNDIEMLQWAGYSVAMGSARESIRALADFVTTPEPGIGVKIGRAHV